MSAQDKLDRSAAKHGLGSDARKRRIQKAKDFFSKPVPSYSKDELRKMGHPVEAYSKPTQAEIDADKRKDGKSKDSSTRYRDLKKKMYGNAMGGLKKETSGQEFTAVPVNTAGDVSGGDRKSIEKLSAMMRKRSKDMRQRESVELDENKVFFVKVGDGRDSTTVKTKAKNSREALKKMRAEHPKDRVSLDINQKQGKSAGTFESSLPAHLQGIIGKGGNIDAKKVKKDPVLNKNKTKVTDVTPTGYGPKEATMADRAVLKAVRIAKDMAGNHTGASKRIEKMKKGLSDHPKVKSALRLANESVSTADKKPQNYRDPETGKLKTRMVPVDKDVVRGNDIAKVVKRKKFKDVR